ncbi:MAG: hypothetical protein AAF125_18115, partial [Chloroflexota bacterium]
WTLEPLRAEETEAVTVGPIYLNGWLLLLVVPALAWTVGFIARQQGPLRGAAVVIAFGGFPIVFGLINLTAVHDYTLMFATGFNVMLWTALLAPLDNRPRLSWLLAVGAVGVFATSAWNVRQVQNGEIEQGATYTYDFDRMRVALDGTSDTLYLDTGRENPECVLRDWQCFALGYYLRDLYLTTDVELAGYALSPRPYFARPLFVDEGVIARVVPSPTNPENTNLYLLNMATATERPAPTEITHTFGDHLALGAWSFVRDVNVRPCERIGVESWWRTASGDLPDANYNMGVVLVADDGSEIAAANAPLGAVATSIWEPESYTFDARSLVVPCDTPAGEYPLIMGVYNPNDLVPLRVQSVDGADLGNQLYLTTIFVEAG